MDEKAIGLLGALAAVAATGRGLRPAAKLMMKGYVAAVDATASTRTDLQRLYAEARDEYRAGRQTTEAPSKTAESASAAPPEQPGA